MSDCPYVLDCPNSLDYCYNSGAVYYRYDPCNCGRPYAGCFAGIYWPSLLIPFIVGLSLGLLPFISFKIHVWRSLRMEKDRHE